MGEYFIFYVLVCLFYPSPFIVSFYHLLPLLNDIYIYSTLLKYTQYALIYRQKCKHTEACRCCVVNFYLYYHHFLRPFCLFRLQYYHHLSLSYVIINHLFSFSLWYCILLIIITVISLFSSFFPNYCIHAFPLCFVIKFDQENNHYR